MQENLKAENLAKAIRLLPLAKKLSSKRNNRFSWKTKIHLQKNRQGLVF